MTEQPSLSISISFTPLELQFLIQALRDLPIKGTPNSLAQLMPLIQCVRLKFASALQTVAGGSPEKSVPTSPEESAPTSSEEPTPITSPPKAPPAAE